MTLTLSADWTVTWSSAAYFSNWQTPDGLAARTPTVTNTPYTRPITHHDEFSVVSGEPVLGGFLYALLTSIGFNSRDPGTETKIDFSMSNLADFDYLCSLVTSNGFDGRTISEETKIEHPVGHNADFCFLYKFVRPPFSILYHLKTTGDDLKDGLSWATAWKTWTHAMQNTPDERTLLVMHGTYAGEAQANPDNSIVIFLVDTGELDNPAVVTVTLA